MYRTLVSLSLLATALGLGCASSPAPQPASAAAETATDIVADPEPAPQARGQLVAVEKEDPAYQRGEALEAAAGRYSQDVSDLIEARQEEFSTCFLRELKKNPNLAGELNVSLSVQPGGTLRTTPSFTTNTLQNSKVETCIVDVLKTLRYPEPFNKEYADVTYLFRFGVF